MGTMGMVVFCECALRGPLPHDSWGSEQPGVGHTAAGYLSERLREVLRQWEDSPRVVERIYRNDPIHGQVVEYRNIVCAHESGESFAVRGQEAYAAIDWAMALEAAGKGQVAPLLSRLTYPRSDFAGDAIVIPCDQAVAISDELDQLGTDPNADLSPVQTWRAAVAASRRAVQPILIGYGM